MSSQYTPPTTAPNYMSTPDWGTSQVRNTAVEVSHLADKAGFAIEILQTALQGFDMLEKEIIDTSNAQHLPTREAIRAFAYRIDTHQKQLGDGLERVKGILAEVNKVTEKMKQSRSSW